MAGADDEVIITIDDDVLGDGAAGDVVVGKKVDAKVDDDATKITKKSDEADPIADLKSQFTTLQRTSQAAVNTALSAANEAKQRADRLETELKEQSVGSQYDTVVAGLEAAESEVEQAKKDYKTAFEAGDGTGAADAQARLARAAVRVERLAEAKIDLESARTERRIGRSEPDQRQQQPTRPADPVEAYVQGRTQPTANWIRQHPEFVTDTTKNAKLTAAHFDAVGEGISVDSPEYFEHVEKFVGLKKPVEQQRQRRPSAPTAPVRHSGEGPSTNGALEVRLTRGEATAATDGTHVWNYDDPTGKNRWKKGDPIGVQEFARRKAAMEQEGRYDRTYVSQ